jgi:hypothetical protein
MVIGEARWIRRVIPHENTLPRNGPVATREKKSPHPISAIAIVPNIGLHSPRSHRSFQSVTDARSIHLSPWWIAFGVTMHGSATIHGCG